MILALIWDATKTGTPLSTKGIAEAVASDQTGPTPQPLTRLFGIDFGTLLSSQGADAHRSLPFGMFSGQPF
jgi:hypothetical protein